MKPQYFTEKFLESVRAISRKSSGKYSGESWVSEVPGFNVGVLPVRGDFDDLPELVCDPADKTAGDFENARNLFIALKDITPVQASDERLWACLSHTTYFDYVQTRWNSKKVSVITSRWFLGGSGIERLARNAIARLWWGAYATYTPETEFQFTETLFRNQDTQSALMERLYSKNFLVLRSFLKFVQINENRIRVLKKKGYGEWIRLAAKHLNLAGGVSGLDFLDEIEVGEILDTYLLNSEENE